MEEVRRRIGFQNGLCVEKVGRSGGLTLFWRGSVICEGINYSRYFINADVVDNEKGRWRFTGFYGMSDHSRRCESW